LRIYFLLYSKVKTATILLPPCMEQAYILMAAVRALVLTGVGVVALLHLIFMLLTHPALVAELTQPFNSLVALAAMAVLILEPVAEAAAVPRGQMVMVARAGQIALRQQQLVEAVAVVTVVEQGLVHPQLEARQAQVQVRAVLVEQQAHLVAQAGRAQTQPRPMYFRAAVAAVLVMVQALRSEAAAVCMVLAGAVPQLLQHPLEALDQLVRWLSPIHPWRLFQPNQLQQLPE
jgi:hypothetical protein